jgi:hypothetical protein
MGAMEYSSSAGRAGSPSIGKDPKVERGGCQPFASGLNPLKGLGCVRLANNR